MSVSDLPPASSLSTVIAYEKGFGTHSARLRTLRPLSEPMLWSLGRFIERAVRRREPVLVSVLGHGSIVMSGGNVRWLVTWVSWRIEFGSVVVFWGGEV